MMLISGLYIFNLLFPSFFKNNLPRTFYTSSQKFYFFILSNCFYRMIFINIGGIMNVEIIIENIYSKINGISNIELVDDLDSITSYYVEGYQYTKAYREGWFDRKTNQFNKWDGKKHLLNNKMIFPTGLLERIKAYLDFRGIDYKIIDNRKQFTNFDSLDIHSIVPRPYQIDAANAAFKHGRGMIRIGTGGGKCLGKGTGVLKFDGTICKVEDIRVGDYLMGPDSKKRKILSITNGVGPLFKINPKRAKSWVCNDVHILTLVKTDTDEIIDIPLNEYLLKNNKFKHHHKQFSVGVEFEKNKEELLLDPYFLGLWFGDGNKSTNELKKIKLRAISNVGITNVDKEIIEYIYSISNENNLKVRKDGIKYFYAGKKYRENIFLKLLRKEVGPNIIIPNKYLVSTRENRLKFLAGYLDSDGYLHNNSYEIVQKRKDWADCIAFVARSLGFRVTISEKYNKKYDRIYYRMFISGNVNEIPLKILRKLAAPRKQKKNALRNGFSVESIGDGEYYGFEIDGDGRFLLDDFTVTHNTAVAAMIIAKYNLPSVVYVIGKDLLYQFQKELSKFLNCEVGVIGDGKYEIKRFNVCSIWTAITSFGLKQSVSVDDEDWSPEIFEIAEDTKKKIKHIVENSLVSVFDEAHYTSTNTIQSIYKASKNCRFLFGMSATPWKDGGDDLLLESICGPRIFNMSASKLIDQGYLVQPKITVLNVPKIKEEPSSYHQAYSSYIVNNQIRNEMVINAAKTLIGMGRKVLILIKQIKHGKILANMLQGIPHYFLNGEIDSETREVVKEAFSDGRLKCLIASNILDMGVDIPVLDSLILAGSGKSSVRALQRIGRAIRKNEDKKDALVVEFWDNIKYLEKHSSTRIAIYQTEPKFIIKFPKDFDHRKIKSSKIINKIKK